VKKEKHKEEREREREREMGGGRRDDILSFFLEKRENQSWLKFLVEVSSLSLMLTRHRSVIKIRYQKQKLNHKIFSILNCCVK